MANFEIIVGSVLGASEYVADALQEKLVEKGHQAQVHLQPDLKQLAPQSTWILCSSTHGAGDLPDNIQAFSKQVSETDLTEVSFLTVGLGDSSYDTFCFAAIKLQQIMQQAGATPLTPPLHIDVLNHPVPENHAVEWLTEWLETTS